MHAGFLKIIEGTLTNFFLKERFDRACLRVYISVGNH